MQFNEMQFQRNNVSPFVFESSGAVSIINILHQQDQQKPNNGSSSLPTDGQIFGFENPAPDIENPEALLKLLKLLNPPLLPPLP